MKVVRLALCSVLCAAMLCPACSVAEGSEGICYRVTGGRNELFLLGSIHIGNESMYPVGEHILGALEYADVIVTECDTESGAVVGQLASMMSYPIGDTLQEHVSEETYALLGEVCAQTGYPIGMMNALRPWAVVSMLTVEASAAEMGVDDIQRSLSLGVERQMGALAGDKPRAYLETAAGQLSVMDGFSAELQEYMLKSVLLTILNPGEYVSPGDADVERWPEWWASGDAESFARSYENGLTSDPEPELMREYHDGLVTRRNLTMAESLRALMESETEHSYFAMIGLMHLVLPNDSVVKHLQDMGYTVERVER